MLNHDECQVNPACLHEILDIHDRLWIIDIHSDMDINNSIMGQIFDNHNSSIMVVNNSIMYQLWISIIQLWISVITHVMHESIEYASFGVYDIQGK